MPPPKITIGLDGFVFCIPLYKNDKLIGALGISGSTVEHDIKVCTRGAEGFI